MRPFIDYVQDRLQNKLYNFARSFDLPDYFMSFTEATWQTSNSRDYPNGIKLFPIHDTMNLWNETDNGYRFQLVPEQKQNKLYILRVSTEGNHYTEEDFSEDYEKLEEIFGYKPNTKLIRSYRSMMEGKSEKVKADIEHAISLEVNKFQIMAESATTDIRKPNEKLWQVTRWMAAKGKNPNENFSGNASQRWTNILRQLDYSAFIIGEIALFFGTHELEVIDEIHN